MLLHLKFINPHNQTSCKCSCISCKQSCRNAKLFIVEIGLLCDRDKKKEFASNYAAYYPLGVDVFLSQRKITHIARFVELPSVNSSGDLPPLLIVNVQVYLFSTFDCSPCCMNMVVSVCMCHLSFQQLEGGDQVKNCKYLDTCCCV